MLIDTAARDNLTRALNTYATRWTVEHEEVENLLGFEAPLPSRNTGWVAGLTAQASDYLSAALYIDAGLPPDAHPTNSSGRLGEALKRWWRATATNRGARTPDIGLRVCVWATMPEPYEHEGVVGCNLDPGQVERLARVVQSITPATDS